MMKSIGLIRYDVESFSTIWLCTESIRQLIRGSDRCWSVKLSEQEEGGTFQTLPHCIFSINLEGHKSRSGSNCNWYLGESGACLHVFCLMVKLGLLKCEYGVLKWLQCVFLCLVVTLVLPKTLHAAERRQLRFICTRKDFNPKTSLGGGTIIRVLQRGNGAKIWARQGRKKNQGEQDDRELTEQRINETWGWEWARMATKVRIQIRTHLSA